MNGNLKRRVLGTLFLATSLLMLILGETWLKHRLGPIATLVYWTSCTLATLCAILCALLDLGSSLRQSRIEQRKMLEETVHDIEAERDRRRKTERNAPPESR
jgi:hypothetical protein